MRRSLIAVVTLLLAMSAYVLVFGSWMRSDVADRGAFVAAALESFELPGSYRALGVAVADRVTEEFPAFGLIDANFDSLFAVLLATEPFQPLLEDVAVDIHARLFDGVQGPVVVDLAEYEEVILRTVAAISPGLVDLLPEDFFRSYVLFEAGQVPDIAAESDAISAASWVAIVAAVVLGMILILVVRTVPTIFFSVGIALLLAAAAGLLLVPAGDAALDTTIQDPEYLVLAQNMFDVITDGLLRRATIVGLAGLVIVIVGALVWLAQRRPVSAQSS